MARSDGWPQRGWPVTHVRVDDDGELLTPRLLRRRGLRGAHDAEFGLRLGDSEAVEQGRAALGDLVNAFLHDRRGNAALFVRAHRLGKELSLREGCRWTAGEETYELRCPIFALHRTVAHSVALTFDSACSVCGAGPFTCDHVSGETYDGAVCHHANGRLLGGLDHVALTADPDFVSTWHQPQRAETARLLADGKISKAGDILCCRHCRNCTGLAEPTDGDLDPVQRWESIVAANMPGGAAKPSPTAPATGLPVHGRH
jgi:hypothetical protein